MQRMSDEPLTSCEVCGAPVQRVFHPIAVHFKGSGFYNTDYGTKRRARELKESAGEGGSSSSSGAESKAEKKSESSPAAAGSTSTSSSKTSSSD